MIHRLLALLPLLLLGWRVAPVPGQPASGRAMSPLAECPAAPPDSGRSALVRGTVRLAGTNRPLAGVLLSISSCSFGYFGAWDFRFTGDSVRTDAQGRSELRFYLQQDRGYAVLFDPAMGRRDNQPSRYVFYNTSDLLSSQDRSDRRLLMLSEVNQVDFTPDFAPSYSQPIDLRLPPVGH